MTSTACNQILKVKYSIDKLYEKIKKKEESFNHFLHRAREHILQRLRSTVEPIHVELTRKFTLFSCKIQRAYLGTNNHKIALRYK